MSLPENFEGKFEILHKLSEGGMGEVYKVRHLLLDQIQVIKVIRSQHEDNEKLGLRFRSEAQTAIRLSHQNIAQIYDFAVGEGSTAYIVMEYIEGKTLKEVLSKRGKLTVELVLEVAHQSLGALDYLHRQGYVHRDISPDNIMLTTAKDGSVLVKLIDLGVAKHIEAEHELTATGMFLGKARYSPPERFRGQATADPRSDVYSFGVMLYELLTGASPIEGTDFTSLASSHLFKPPVSFEITDPDGRVPRDLRTVIFHALEKDPDDRIGSAAELDRRLEPFRLVGSTVSMPTSGAQFNVSEVKAALEDQDEQPEKVEVEDRAESAKPRLTDATVRHGRPGRGRKLRFSKRTMSIAALLAVVIAGGLWWGSTRHSSSNSAQADVPEDERLYLEAVDRLEAGVDTGGVPRLLRAAIKSNGAESAKRDWVTAGRDDPYLPYFYLGLAYFEQNNCAMAPDQLAKSEQQGAIQTTPMYDQLEKIRAECEQAFAKDVERLARNLDAARLFGTTLETALANPRFDTVWRTSPNLETEIGSQLRDLRDLGHRFETARQQGAAEVFELEEEVARVKGQLDKLVADVEQSIPPD